MQKVYEGYNLVEEGVLLLQPDKILFANNTALDLFGWSLNQMEKMTIGNVPLSSNMWLLTEQKVSFEEMVKKSMSNHIDFYQYFTLDTLKKTVKVKISPSDDSVWCIISTIQTPKACECDKKNEWYDKFVQMNVLTCVVVEYYSELQDWKVLFMPKFAANYIHVPTDCEGNFVIRDMRLRPELVAKVFTQDILDDNSPLPEGIKVIDFPMEGVKENKGKIFYRRLKSQYLGRSKEGRPIKVMTASDITDLKLCEIELDNRQKILDIVTENQENLRVLFDNFPTMMGIVEVTDDGKIHEIMTNPMTREYHLKRKGYTPDDKDKEDEFWISKYRESKRLGKPVYFEMPDDQYGKKTK